MKDVTLISFFDERFYKVEDKYYPSVTTVLSMVDKPELRKWVGELGNREASFQMHEAQDKGKRIHHAWELYCAGKTIGYHRWEIDEEKPEADFLFVKQGEYLDFLKLVKFREQLKPSILHSEMVVYSDTIGCAGTVDNVFYIPATTFVNGRSKIDLVEGRYIVDVKSGKNVYDESFMQIAAYAKFHEECGLGDIVGGMILHTNSQTKTGIPGFSVKVRTKEQLSEDFSDFLYVKGMWDRKHKNSAPKEFEYPQTVKWEVK